MKKIFLTLSILACVLISMNVFAKCNLSKTISCWRGGYLNTGTPCTLLKTKHVYPYVFIAGIFTAGPPAFPGDNPKNKVKAQETSERTWEKAIWRFYDEHESLELKLPGEFSCYGGFDLKEPFKKVNCNEVIDYGKEDQGNC